MVYSKERGGILTTGITDLAYQPRGRGRQAAAL